MSSLFNGRNSDGEDELKINKGYANLYNSYRQKEEFYKLKTRYGEHIKNSEDESETSSDEDEEGVELTEQFEKDFYKTLACLKNKDPKIYNDNVKFFKNNTQDDSAGVSGSGEKPKKEDKLFLRDYERRIVIERGGKFSDSEDEDTFHQKKYESREPTYVEEQRALKESISKALEDEDEDEGAELLKPKAKTAVEKLKEEETYKEWLKGQQTEIDNEEKEALKPLRDFWTDPNLDPKEKFLRDYVLNKKFLGRDDDEDEEDDEAHRPCDKVHDSDENLSEDERNIEKQEEFEHKYNFRFEEPDQEFIKRYPRTLENSLRKKDGRRSQKRAEVKQRKEEEKIRKQEELKQLKAMKRKEIEEKIDKLREITGNDDIRMDSIDLEGEFDPAEHDRKMRELFNDEYYAEGDDEMKPEFPDIDDELGIDKNWDDYDPTTDVFVPDAEEARKTNPDCEDPDFNMDADYDPTKSFQAELIDASRKKKKRRRSKFAEVMAKEKPKFDPSVHSSYRDYIEQYYALDYEDMIDDLPCRFKYRKVVPNDYGLSVEEILMADDHDLNKWCSLKKALEHKPEEVEKREVLSYKQKASNEAYKKRILRSLYTPEEEPQDPETEITPSNQQNDQPAKKKRKPKKKKKSGEHLVVPKLENKNSAENSSKGVTVKVENVADNKVSKKKKFENTNPAENSSNGPMVKVENVADNKVSKKKKFENTNSAENSSNGPTVKVENVADNKVSKKKKFENTNSAENSSNGPTVKVENVADNKVSKKKKLDNTNSAENSSNGPTVKIENAADGKAPNEKKHKKAKTTTDAIPAQVKIKQEVTIPADVTVKSEKRKANKSANETALSSQQETDEPRAKKSKLKTNNMSRDTENHEVSGQQAQKIFNNSKNSNPERKLHKKNKKRSSVAPGSNKHFNNKNAETDQVALLSAERLKAYGINPKKFKNKLKYGKQK